MACRRWLLNVAVSYVLTSGIDGYADTAPRNKLDSDAFMRASKGRSSIEDATEALCSIQRIYEATSNKPVSWRQLQNAGELHPSRRGRLWFSVDALVSLEHLLIDFEGNFEVLKPIRCDEPGGGSTTVIGQSGHDSPTSGGRLLIVSYGQSGSLIVGAYWMPMRGEGGGGWG